MKQSAIQHRENRNEIDHKVGEMAGRLGIESLLDRRPDQLSAGQAQRVAFARALLQRPQWLFLDEAASNLDNGSEAKLYTLLIDRLPGTALITLSGRGQVADHHEQRWELQPANGRGYELRKA